MFACGCLIQEVPPLDVPELLAYLVRQSEPFLDQLGVRKGKQLEFYYFLNLHVGWKGILYARMLSCECNIFANIASLAGQFLNVGRLCT